MKWFFIFVNVMCFVPIVLFICGAYIALVTDNDFGLLLTIPLVAMSTGIVPAFMTVWTERRK